MGTTFIPVLGKQRQEDSYEFQAFLVNREVQGYIEKPCVENNERKKEKKIC